MIILCKRSSAGNEMGFPFCAIVQHIALDFLGIYICPGQLWAFTKDLGSVEIASLCWTKCCSNTVFQHRVRHEPVISTLAKSHQSVSGWTIT